MLIVRQSRGGFTVIEMIVVIAVLAMIGGVVLVRQPWKSSRLDSEVTVRALVSAMRLARSRAIVQDRNVAIITGGNAFAIDGGTPSLLPDGEALSRSQVVFLPDGGASGSPVVVSVGRRRIAISANWLTGRVVATELDGS